METSATDFELLYLWTKQGYSERDRKIILKCCNPSRRWRIWYMSFSIDTIERECIDAPGDSLTIDGRIVRMLSNPLTDWYSGMFQCFVERMFFENIVGHEGIGVSEGILNMQVVKD